MTPERQKLIDKLNKLRSMTQAAGATEAEALTAATLCAKLIAEFNIQASEIETREFAKLGGIVHETINYFGAKREHWIAPISALASLLSVKLWYQHIDDDFLELGITSKMTQVHLMGFPEDVGVVQHIASLIREAFIYETNIYMKRTKSGRDVNSFQYGMAERIKERIKELYTPVIINQSGAKHGSLVVVKKELVLKEFATLGIRLGSVRVKGPSNSSAYSQGREAGGRANLSGQPGQLRLGRG